MGWHINESQDNKIAAREFIRICKEQNIMPNQLKLHADNGSPMKGATMLATLEKLGVTKSFSRPATSNDNPFSESIFKTVKYNSRYPRKPFDRLEEARSWTDSFVCWYNLEHKHSGICFVTPYERHNGLHYAVLRNREKVYQKAKSSHPERWSKDIKSFSPQEKVCINAPEEDEET